MLQLGQLYERRSGLDFGIDGTIELTTDEVAKRATGRKVGVQVKRGLSVVKRTRYGFTLYCTKAHANYWLRHSLPITVVHSDPAIDRLRWKHVATNTLRRTSEGYAIDLPPESDLRTSLDALRALADGQSPPTASAGRTFILPYSMQNGIRIGDPELGLAALEFSRAALRGEDCRVVVEAEEEPDLVASIAAIRDVADPTAEERRDAIVREDDLHHFRKHTDKLQRALMLLLTEQALVEPFGYRASFSRKQFDDWQPLNRTRESRGTSGWTPGRRTTKSSPQLGSTCQRRPWRSSTHRVALTAQPSAWATPAV